MKQMSVSFTRAQVQGGSALFTLGQAGEGRRVLAIITVKEMDAGARILRQAKLRLLDG